jgi:hypothetical protein
MMRFETFLYGKMTRAKTSPLGPVDKIQYALVTDAQMMWKTYKDKLN